MCIRDRRPPRRPADRLAHRHPQRRRPGTGRPRGGGRAVAGRRRAPGAARTRAAAPRGAGAVDSTTVLPPGPVRTCVGCRERAAKTTLLRVVADGDRLVPDPSGRMPGRGASVHPDLRCVDLAEKRRAFPRALRLPGPLDLAAVRETVQQAAGAAAPPQPPVREQVETPHEHSMSQSR